MPRKKPTPSRTVNDLREWRATIARHDTYDELILRFEHDVFDQLNLIQLLAWIQGHLPPMKPASLVCIGSFAGRPDFKGLGQLTPDELASFETRQRIGDALRGSISLTDIGRSVLAGDSLALCPTWL